MDDPFSRDFDGFWKSALDRFLIEALELLAPEVAAEVDTAHPYQSLEQEFQQLFPESRSGRRFVDKLFKLRMRSGKDVAFLLHIEVQSDPDPQLPQRMFVYHYRLFDRYPLDICALAILADDDPRFRPDVYRKTFLGNEIAYHFHSIKLLDLVPQLQELADSPNPFAVLVLAYLRTRGGKPDRARLHFKFEITCAICERGLPIEHARELLRLVDWIMQLPTELKTEYQHMVSDYAERKNMPILMDLEIEAMERGRAEGFTQGQSDGEISTLRKNIQQLLAARFGPLPAPWIDRLSKITDPSKLNSLFKRAIVATSLEAFESG